MVSGPELTISETKFIRISYGVIAGGASSVILVVIFLLSIQADSRINSIELVNQKERIDKIEERYVEAIEKQNERLRSIEANISELTGYLKRQHD